MIGRRTFLGPKLGLGLGLGLTLGLSAAPLSAAPRKRPEFQGVVAETSRGRVRGVNNEGIRTFKGIPYGAPTDGPNRFRTARPAVPWTGIRDAMTFGPMCPQEKRPRPSITASWAVEQPMNEDCLTLNIWTPALRDHHKRPVMVWIHGETIAPASAVSPVSDGTSLARRGDVVVVSVTYRLGVFGHLYLARAGGTDYAESGNLGVLDLAAALRWMHTNIAEFGGDPGNITIFGQGEGGAKVSVLMALPQMRGLFHRAIVQSGSYLDIRTPDEASEVAAAFLKAAEIPATELPRLQKLSTEQILAAQKKLTGAASMKSLFGPVTDGRLLQKAPWASEAPANSAAIPMLIGTTKTETTSMIGALDPSVFAPDRDIPRNRLSGWLPASEAGRVTAGYRKFMTFPKYTDLDLFFAITSARQVRQHAWLQAERKAAQNAGPVWLYELDWQTPVDGGKWRSPHGLDLAFVFDNAARSESMTGRGEEPRLLAENMSNAWIAFARAGNPNNKTLPQWPPFRAPERSTMIFRTKSEAVNDPAAEERQVLAALPAWRAPR